MAENAERPDAWMSGDARYRILVDAVIDYAIYMLDPSGIVTSWNSGAQRLKGYLEQEIIGERFSASTRTKTGRQDCRSERSRPPNERASSKTRAGAYARTAPASGLTS